jgi:hypothetical protein
MIIGDNKIDCFVCGDRIADNATGEHKAWKKTDVTLSNGTYASITTCKTCNVTPEDFESIEHKMKDGWLRELDMLAWSDEKKEQYKANYMSLKITGYK